MFVLYRSLIKHYFLWSQRRCLPINKHATLVLPPSLKKSQQSYLAVTKITFMDETSRNNSNNGSPFDNLCRDMLFEILLKLPIDSILIVMTLLRFELLRDSDFFWKSLCKRDYGDGLVNDIESSNQCQTWETMYWREFRFNGASCRMLYDPGIDRPLPRASHSLNFVSNCLVLFGGATTDNEGGHSARRLDDPWVAYIGNDYQRELKWHRGREDSPRQRSPSRRFGHSCVVSGDYLVLFGGINGGNIYHDDTWVGQVAYDENQRVTLTWRLLVVGSERPPRRGAHGACCINNRKMVIHGGRGFNGVLDDAWVLEISENFLSGSWRKVTTRVSPPARLGHTLTCIRRNQAVLFGGSRGRRELLGDLWLLDVSKNSFTWVDISNALRNGQRSTLSRVGHSATRVWRNRLLIHGGEDSSGHRKNDFWVLNTEAIVSTGLDQRMLDGDGLFPELWRRVDMVGYEPICRSLHQACAGRSRRYVYVFGGKVDEPAEATGYRYDGELLLVDLFSLH